MSFILLWESGSNVFIELYSYKAYRSSLTYFSIFSLSLCFCLSRFLSIYIYILDFCPLKGLCPPHSLLSCPAHPLPSPSHLPCPSSPTSPRFEGLAPSATLT